MPSGCHLMVKLDEYWGEKTVSSKTHEKSSLPRVNQSVKLRTGVSVHYVPLFILSIALLYTFESSTKAMFGT